MRRTINYNHGKFVISTIYIYIYIYIYIFVVLYLVSVVTLSFMHIACTNAMFHICQASRDGSFLLALNKTPVKLLNAVS